MLDQDQGNGVERFPVRHCTDCRVLEKRKLLRELEVPVATHVAYDDAGKQPIARYACARCAAVHEKQGRRVITIEVFWEQVLVQDAEDRLAAPEGARTKEERQAAKALTFSGRYSSSQPNLANLPRPTKWRP